MKELFIAAHEELIEEYLEVHPEADWSEAYEKTGDLAYNRYIDKAADIADTARGAREDSLPVYSRTSKVLSPRESSSPKV